MFCFYCGSPLENGDQFCSACGKPVVDADPHSPDTEKSDSALDEDAGAVSDSRDAKAPADRAKSSSEQSHGKPSPRAITAIAIALVAIAVLAIVLVAQQADRPAPQVGSAEAPGQNLSPEEQAIAGLDGWWAKVYHHDTMGYQPVYGNVHDDSIDWYRYDPVAADVSYYSTDEITKAERFSENGSEGWRFFTEASKDGSWAYYEADGNESDLPVYRVSLGYGTTDADSGSASSPERYGMTRITDPAALDQRALLEKAQDLAAKRAETGEPTSHVEEVDPEQARAEAREAAAAEGKQVFSGTIMSTTDNDAWIMSTGRNPNAGRYYTNRNVTIILLDEKTAIEGVDTNNKGRYKTISDQDVIELPDSFAAGYDGCHVEMAFSKDDLQMPSDVRHIKGDGEVIFADDYTGAESAPSAASTASDDYILPDSTTKRYSRQELDKYDDHTLFLARNEIFARHGRKFQSAELQQYFGSKSWYRGTIEPSAFDESMLSDVERENAYLMRDIETARGSAYL